MLDMSAITLHYVFKMMPPFIRYFGQETLVTVVAILALAES